MKYVGVDLHKNSITLCVKVKSRGKRKVLFRRTFPCSDTGTIRRFFEELGKFRAVVEATASYEWFVLLIEDLADRVVLAHPKKLRVIAESKQKTDRIDAATLAEFLALDMIPEAYRPSPRIHQYRVLVRHRHRLQSRITAAKCQVRHKAARYNADIPALFTARGEEHLAKIAMCEADRFEVRQLQDQLEWLQTQRKKTEAELREFAKSAPLAEREARAVLETIPLTGPVTIDVILSELGDWRRFRSAKKVVAFAGLAPGFRNSANKQVNLSITKEGSPLLRWAMIEAAWRLVGKTTRWRRVYDHLKRKTGSAKKAIVGTARRLLCVIFAMLRKGESYRMAA